MFTIAFLDCVMIFIVLVVITQIVVPAFKKERMFPILRKKK